MRRLENGLVLALIIGIGCTQIRLPDLLGTLNRTVGIALVLVWIPLTIRRGRIRRPQLFHLLLFALVTWSAATLIWTPDADTGFDKIQRYVQSLVSSLILWDIIRTRRQAEAAFQALVVGATIAVCATIWDYISNTSIYSSIGRYAAEGFNPDDIASQIVIAVPAATYLFFVRTDQKIGWRLLNGIFPAAALMAVILTGVRGAFVALIVPAIYWGWRMVRAGVLGKVIALAALIAVLIIIPRLDLGVALQRILDIGSSASTDRWNGRLDLWENGIKVFLSAPLTGVGLGGFATRVFYYLNLPWVAHNAYLSVAAETGLLGLLLFLGAVGSVAGSLIIRKDPGRGAFIATFLAWAVAAAALTWEDVPQTWLTLTLLLVLSKADPAAVEAVEAGDRKSPGGLPLAEATAEYKPVGPGTTV